MSRNFSDVLARVDAEVPADHPVRAAGWDSAARALHVSYVYSAPEMVANLWPRIGNACSTHFTQYAQRGEAWALRASAVLKNDTEGCYCCQAPSKTELDAMIQAHPERLVVKDNKAAAEALLLLHASNTVDADVMDGAKALLHMKHRAL